LPPLFPELDDLIWRNALLGQVFQRQRVTTRVLPICSSFLVGLPIIDDDADSDLRRIRPLRDAVIGFSGQPLERRGLVLDAVIERERQLNGLEIIFSRFPYKQLPTMSGYSEFRISNAILAASIASRSGSKGRIRSKGSRR
jgi:hypothetical protein